jgi:hypothetical protein
LLSRARQEAVLKFLVAAGDLVVVAVGLFLHGEKANSLPSIFSTLMGANPARTLCESQRPSKPVRK